MRTLLCAYLCVCMGVGGSGGGGPAGLLLALSLLPLFSFLLFHTKLYSLRLSCRMVSLTAAKTKRMFSVSVAHVKWE